MKKYLNYALYYAVAALIGGVFYREFTKLNNFTGETFLSYVHVHLFVLGMMMFLIVALFAKEKDLRNEKLFCKFLVTYNFGVILTTIMFIVRGILQVLSTKLSPGQNGMISGFAGIGHIFVGAGIILLITSLKRQFDR